MDTTAKQRTAPTPLAVAPQAESPTLPVDGAGLAGLGPALGTALTAAQNEQADALAARLADGNLEKIHAFGRELGQHTAAHADNVLEQVRASDLDLIGTKLGQIVTAAQSLNLHALSDRRSKIPLIGPWIDKLRLNGSEFMRKFQDVKSQIDVLLDEVETMQSGLAERNDGLEASFESVREEHALLGVHIAAGEKVLKALKQRAARPSAAGDDAFKAQERQDTAAAVAALEKRIADLRVLQHASLQQLPMIRMVQANNRMLIEKFHTIKELTVPSWKRQFMLALSLNEQKNAVDLANSIDDATNEFLRENARLLKDNTISTAKANQRLVIDVETLREVHDTLMSTVQEVITINKEGARSRATAGQQLLTLRQSMARQLGGA